MTLFIGGCKDRQTMPTDGRDFYQQYDHLGTKGGQSHFEVQIYRRHVIRSPHQDVSPDWRHPFVIPEDYYSH